MPEKATDSIALDVIGEWLKNHRVTRFEIETEHEEIAFATGDGRKEYIPTGRSFLNIEGRKIEVRDR